MSNRIALYKRFLIVRGFSCVARAAACLTRSADTARVEEAQDGVTRSDVNVAQHVRAWVPVP